MTAISLDSQIRLHPLSRQLENGVAIIGRGDQFLELPPEGLHFLAWLDQGLSLAEARQRFEVRFNPFPDPELFAVLEAFLATNRPGGQGSSDIWIATRASTGTPFSPSDFQPASVLNSITSLCPLRSASAPRARFATDCPSSMLAV